MKTINKPSILFYADYYKPVYSGLTTSLERILSELCRLNKYDIHLLTYNHKKSKKSPVNTHQGFTLHYHGEGEGNIAYLYALSTTKKIIELHKKYNFDLMAAFYAHMPLLTVATAASILGVPYIVCARGSDINHNMTNPFHRKKMKKYIDDAHSLICVSDKMSMLVKKWGVAPKNNRVFAIGNSINTETFAVSRDIKENSEKKYDFLFIGSARPVKRFDLVLNAAEKLKQKLPDFRIAAVLLPHRQHIGLADEYKRSAQSKGIERFINFLEPMPSSKIKNLYGLSHCVILASDNEGCSNIILEAMASGCYVLARKNIMPKCLIGKHNLTFSDADELMDCMIEITKKPHIIVKDNISLLQKHFRVEKEISAYDVIISSAIKHKEKLS